MRKGTLNRNPASLADPPKRDGEMRVWTSAQLRTFLASLDGERLAPAFVLAADTGMRRGEIAGLRWADLDLDAKLIHVRQNPVVVDYDAAAPGTQESPCERGELAAAVFSRLMAVPDEDPVEASQRRVRP